MESINNINTTLNDTQKSKPYPIVAIGASAGGLDAIVEFLKYLPPNTGMAYIYIQHLDRDYDSNLTTILSRATKMKVQFGADLMKIEPDCLFVIPPNKEMAIIDGVINVTPRPEDTPFHLLIDHFFLSLAEKQKQGSIGIILSGAASDGTVGLKAIKMAGGLTFAQNDTAQFKSMPKSAIAEGAVDLVLSPKEIAEELERLSKQANIFSYIQGDREEDLPSESDEEIKNVLQLIKRSTGVDFGHYKINTIRRRILRRMLLYKLITLSDYVQYIKQHANEVNILYADLLINVTTFFRDAEAMEYLQKKWLPEVLLNKAPNDPLRIWIPACSSGEEPYTIAMTVLEYLGDKAAGTAIQIFATDLSELAINKARLGIYTANDVANITPERLQRFFTRIDGHYRIHKTIRDLCVFAPHNIFKDPPFSRLDLISCCNLLIYLDNVLQKKIMGTFHYALNDKGYLLLGKSETISNSTNLFTSLDKKIKIYSKRKDAGSRAMFDMDYRIPERVLSKAVINHKPLIKENGAAANLDRVIDNIFLTQFTPPSVVINHDLEIIQFRGATNLFLEPAPGKASFNILKMVHTGLAIELRAAIHKCIKSGEAVKVSRLELQRKDRIQQVSIEVQPLEIAAQDRLLLIIFNEEYIKEIPEAESQPTDLWAKHLENELIAVREDMRMLLEEHEATSEEMQSANEEIVSSNEELQSINEELETSKEEIESTNEELMTINQELTVRNDQLAEAQEYTEAVIATIREAVVMLDEDLRIRSANKAFYRIFGLEEETTEGRLIYELNDRQWDIPKLREVLEALSHHNDRFQGLEIKHTFPQLGEKILCLDARKIIQQSYKKQIILLSIEDITERRKSERMIEEKEVWLRNMTDSVPAMIWVAGPDQQYTYVNKTWQQYTGRTLPQEINRGWIEGIHKEDIVHYLEKYVQCFESKQAFRIEYRMKRQDGEFRWVLCSAVPTYSEGIFSGFTGTCIEVHNEKLMNEELERKVQERTREIQEANNNLERSNKELEQFAYIASHDLQEPLRKITTFSDRLGQQFKEEVPQQGKEYIEKIIASAQRMTQLIDDLLNFSRIAQVKKGVAETNMNEVLRAMLIDFELMLKEKKAQVVCNKPLPVLQANRLQMRQLFHNLLSNALKFSSEERAPVIEISSRIAPAEEILQYPVLDKNKIYHEIIFKDNGIGFKQEYAEQVFAIFQRLHERSKYPGTGIGLALCRKIVENHNGIINARAEEDKGAAFIIFLPENGAPV